ncbi:hypothetical protein ANTPLA_LOCUS8971 [Anthophora plagiata]
MNEKLAKTFVYKELKHFVAHYLNKLSPFTNGEDAVPFACSVCDNESTECKDMLRNPFCGENIAPEAPLGNSLQDARSPSLPALLATSGKEERAWTMERNSGMEANRRAGTTLRNVFVNIHPTHEARAARVAVNPGTLILMRLRHVQHTRALYSAGSPRRRKHESSTEFTTPSVYRT